MSRSWLPSFRSLLSLCLALALGACASQESGGTEPSQVSTSTQVAPVSGSSDVASNRCDEDKALAVVEGFVEAYSSPRADPLSFIADEGDFKWYSDDLRLAGAGGDPRLDPYDRNSLGDYLSWQRETRPLMEIDALEVASVDELDGTLGVQIEVTWGGQRHRGKVAVACDQLKIQVFSLGASL